jgi:hypothetical protein
MTQERWTRALILTGVALALVVAVVGQSGPGWEASAAEKAEVKKKEFRGRLPAYYNRVVDDAQRKKIYAIQGEFAPKIDALKAQLAALTEERNKQVDAVLSPEQLKAVEDLKAEAKAKRDKAKRAAE